MRQLAKKQTGMQEKTSSEEFEFVEDLTASEGEEEPNEFVFVYKKPLDKNATQDLPHNDVQMNRGTVTQVDSNNASSDDHYEEECAQQGIFHSLFNFMRSGISSLWPETEESLEVEEAEIEEQEPNNEASSKPRHDSF